jgi:hypothetical protein
MVGSPHFLWWTVGALLGAVATLNTLRRFDLLSFRPLIVLFVAGALLQVGAKWQFRLEIMPVREALSAPPAEHSHGGMRMPLGVTLGGCGALLCALLLGVDWRRVGDALAGGASVMMAVGRIGPGDDDGAVALAPTARASTPRAGSRRPVSSAWTSWRSRRWGSRIPAPSATSASAIWRR